MIIQAESDLTEAAQTRYQISACSAGQEDGVVVEPVPGEEPPEELSTLSTPTHDEQRNGLGLLALSCMQPRRRHLEGAERRRNRDIVWRQSNSRRNSEH